MALKGRTVARGPLNEIDLTTAQRGHGRDEVTGWWRLARGGVPGADRQAVTGAQELPCAGDVAWVGNVRRLAGHSLHGARRPCLAPHARLAGTRRGPGQAQGRRLAASAPHPAHALLDLHKTSVAALGRGRGDGQMAPLLGDGEVFLRRPDGKSSRPRHLPRRALPDNPASGHGTAYDGVENLGLGRQRTDAKLERATGRGMDDAAPSS